MADNFMNEIMHQLTNVSNVENRYKLGTFWLRYVLTKNGYVLVLYILMETMYKFKVHEF